MRRRLYNRFGPADEIEEVEPFDRETAKEGAPAFGTNVLLKEPDNFPSSLVLEGPAGITIPAHRMLTAKRFELVDKTRLLNIDMGDVPDSEYWPGSWMLTIFPDIVSSFEEFDQLAPIVANIELGQGGASARFQVDVMGGAIISLPVGRVTVEVGWDRIAESEQLPAGLSAPSVRVNGALQRSFGKGRAYRTRYGFLGDGELPVSQVAPIEPFAHCARLHAPIVALTSFDSSPEPVLTQRATGSSTYQLQADGWRAQELAESGCCFPLHPQAQYLSYRIVAQGVPGASVNHYTIVQELEL